MPNESEIPTRSRKEMTVKAKYLNIVILLVLLGVSAYIIARTVTDVGIILFTYHPTFIVLGYLILMSNAILIMADNNFLTMNLSHQNRVTAHWIVQVFAVVLISIAQICIFTNKVNYGKPHFQTTHAIFGLITYLLTLLTSLGGVFTKYSFQLRNILKPAIFKILHSLSGIVIYILAIVTIILGFNQMWHEKMDENVIKPILIALLVISGLYVLIKSFLLFITRVKDFLSR